MTRSVAILYGSETGNAQDYAGTLSRKLEYLRFNVKLCSMNEFDPKNLLSFPLLIIVCSTTGQGELPRNGIKFFKFLLKKKLPSNLLNHLSFSTFGLGDSSYPKFNFAIRKIHARLLQLGATEFSGRAESDEQSAEGSDGYYSEWEKAVIENLKEQYPLPKNLEPIKEDTLLPPKYEISVKVNEPDIMTEAESKTVSISRQFEGLKTGKIVKNERVTAPGHFQDIRHLIIEDIDKSLEYKPGDSLALFPSNDPEDVEHLLVSQNWKSIADKPIEIFSIAPYIEGGLISQLTLRSILTHHLDIMSIPRRSFFMLLWQFASDDREREKLRDFANLKEAEDLYNYANRPRRSILETILEFFSLKIPVEYIFDLFPTIKPRLFSIASKPSASTVELVIGIVEYKTMLRRIRRGVCTRWIKTLNPNDKIRFTLHKSNLDFGDNEDPVIMVSPGTGIAPMKSLIGFKTLASTTQKLFLFYGCRFHDKDYLFKDYWETLKAQNQLEIFPCFSRESGGYVQNKLYEQRETVFKLLFDEKAKLFVCGSSGSMPTQVRITIETILEEIGKLSKEEAAKFLVDMENSGRYIQETW